MSARLGSALRTLIVLVFITGRIDAVTLVSTVDGGKYRFDNLSAAADHSGMLKAFYDEEIPEEYDDSFPVPISSTEIQLIVEFVNNKTAGDQHQAAQRLRNRYEGADLEEQCRLLKAFHYLEMDALMGEIAASYFRRSNKTAMHDLLSEDVIAFLLQNSPLKLLEQFAHAEDQKAIVNEIRDLILFKREANLTNNAEWEDGVTVLQWAVVVRERTIVELLVNIPGVDVNLFHCSSTPLELAYFVGDPDIIEILSNSLGVVAVSSRKIDQLLIDATYCKQEKWPRR